MALILVRVTAPWAEQCFYLLLIQTITYFIQKDQKSVRTNIHLDNIYQDILKFIRTYEAAEEILMSGECLLTGAE